MYIENDRNINMFFCSNKINSTQIFVTFARKSFLQLTKGKDNCNIVTTCMLV